MVLLKKSKSEETYPIGFSLSPKNSSANKLFTRRRTESVVAFTEHSKIDKFDDPVLVPEFKNTPFEIVHVTGFDNECFILKCPSCNLIYKIHPQILDVCFATRRKKNGPFAHKKYQYNCVMTSTCLDPNCEFQIILLQGIGKTYSQKEYSKVKEQIDKEIQENDNIHLIKNANNLIKEWKTNADAILYAPTKLV